MITVGQLFLNRTFDVSVGKEFNDSTIIAVLYPCEIIVSQRVYDEIEKAIKKEESLEFIREMQITFVIQSLFTDLIPPNMNNVLNFN